MRITLCGQQSRKPKAMLTSAQWLCLWSLCSAYRECGRIFITQLSKTSPISLATAVIQATFNSHLGHGSRLLAGLPETTLTPLNLSPVPQLCKLILSLLCLKPPKSIPFAAPLRF